MSEFGEQLDWFNEIGYDGANPKIKKQEKDYNNDMIINTSSIFEDVFRKFETTNLGEKWAKKTKK